MSTTSAASVLSRLQHDLHGTVLLTDDPDYDIARKPWNLAIEQRPAAIAVPDDVDDVRAIIAAAAEAGLGVTTQPNGHGASGDLTDVILVRPVQFDELSIDADARIGRVGAGVNWGRVLHELDGTGLVALAGSNPEVNVVGYSINGGHSMFSRRYGLAAHSVTAVELVDGTGAVLRVTEQSDPELLWALRGGGGLFGVITAIEFRLHPADALFGGTLMFPADAAAEVISTAYALAQDEPDLGMDLGMARFPEMPMVPEPLRGKTVVSVGILRIGDAAGAAPIVDRLRAIAPVVADTTTEFTIGQLAALAGEPTEPMATIDWGSPVAALDHDAAEALAAAFLSGADHGLMRLGVRVLGGAIGAPADPSAAAIGAMTAPALGGAGMLVFDPSAFSRAEAAFAPLRAFAAAHPATGMVPTFLAAGGTLADAYDAATIERLSAIKNRVDPQGIIRSNRPLG